MLILTYSLKQGGPERLKVSYKTNWKDLTLTIDDRVIGTVPNKEALKQGVCFTLNDGSWLELELKRRNFILPISFAYGKSLLKIYRNGIPLPGSADDPQNQINQAINAIYLAGIFNILGGFLFIAPVFDQVLGIQETGILAIVFGVFFVILGYVTSQHLQYLSCITLLIAITLYGADLVLLVISVGVSNLFSLLMKISLLSYMIQGLYAMMKLPAQKKALQVNTLKIPNVKSRRSITPKNRSNIPKTKAQRITRLTKDIKTTSSSYQTSRSQGDSQYKVVQFDPLERSYKLLNLKFSKENPKLAEVDLINATPNQIEKLLKRKNIEYPFVIWAMCADTLKPGEIINGYFNQANRGFIPEFIVEQE